MNCWKSSAIAVVLTAALVALVFSHRWEAQAHIEDICVAPPGKCLKCGIYNFYTFAQRLGCDYLDDRSRCVLATLIEQSSGGFVETSNCRGIIHFNAIYFAAVALGFKQEIAYHFAAFSQAIDFVQYKGVDSCGQPMNNAFWTPPLRGLLRTQTTFGGTNRHLGVPFVGLYDSLKVYPPDLSSSTLYGERLTQRKKLYKGIPGMDVQGCRMENFEKSNEFYASTCAGLLPNFSDPFYEGSLHNARKWAFGDSDHLCTAGFTVEDPETGSVFTGKECPKAGRQYQVNIGKIVQGPIPLTGMPMELGEQVFQFDCIPSCNATNYTIDESTVVRTHDFGAYLNDQATKNGYAVLSDPPGPVPELVARFGIYLHWVADRNSHWYCCDASSSGVMGVRDGDHFNLFMYLSARSCNFVNHGMVHYWEQGVSELAPGSYFALVNMYNELAAFREKHLQSKPEWFRAGANIMSFEEVVGTKANPGILYNVTNIPNAMKRFKAEVDALKAHDLPPMPGFEKLCDSSPADPSLKVLLQQKLSGKASESSEPSGDYGDDEWSDEP